MSAESVPAESPVVGSVKQVAQYLVVGGLSFLIDLAVLSASVRLAHLSPSVGALLGFAVGTAANFLLNRMVFGPARGMVSAGMRYLVLLAANALITVGAIWALTRQGMAPEFAKGIVSAALVVTNYLLYRHWVYA